MLVEKCLDPSSGHGEEDLLMESRVAIPIWMYHDNNEPSLMVQRAIEEDDEFSRVCHQVINKTVDHGLEVIKTTVQEPVCVGGKSGKRTCTFNHIKA